MSIFHANIRTGPTAGDWRAIEREQLDYLSHLLSILNDGEIRSIELIGVVDKRTRNL